MTQPYLLSSCHRLACLIIPAVALVVSGCAVDIRDPYQPPPPPPVEHGNVAGSVVLTDAGPLAEFSVRLEDRFQSSPCLLCYGYSTREVGRAVTDAEGNFRMDDIEVGTYWIKTAWPTGYGPPSGGGQITVRANQTKQVSLVFEPWSIDP